MPLWGTGSSNSHRPALRDVAGKRYLANTHANVTVVHTNYEVGTGTETGVQDGTAMIAVLTSFSQASCFLRSKPNGNEGQLNSSTRSKRICACFGEKVCPLQGTCVVPTPASFQPDWRDRMLRFSGIL